MIRPACVTCGEQPIWVHAGTSFYLVPKRVRNCWLNKNPQTRCGGSIINFCRTGFCLTRADADRQWAATQKAAAPAPGAEGEAR